MNKFIKNTLKTTIFLAILTAASVGFSKVSNAIISLQGGQPIEGYRGDLGYMPQPSADGRVYCTDWNSPIRWGQKDRTVYYGSKSDYTGAARSYTYTSVYDQGIKDKAYSKYKGLASATASKYISDHDGTITDYNKNNPTHSETINYSGDIDPNKALIAVPAYQTADEINRLVNTAKSSVENFLGKKFSELAQTKAPYNIGNGYDVNGGNYEGYRIKWDGDTAIGPKVAIVGSGDTTNYKAEWVKNVDSSSSSSFEDIMNAYILNGRRTNYSTADVQTAVWLQNDHEGAQHGYNANGSGSSTLSVGTGNGYKLYFEAKNYYNFNNKLRAAGSYENLISMQSNNSQVFVNRVDSNRNQDEYIVGPFTVTYPQYTNISYIADMKVQAGNKTLSYKSGDFSIRNASGNNSLPSSGENFWVVVNANKAGYPEQLTVTPTFEYVTSVKATYSRLVGDGAELRIYPYKGHLLRGNIQVSCRYTFRYTDKNGKTKYYTYYNKENFVALQGYIQMDLNDYEEADEQELLDVVNEYGGGRNTAQASRSATVDLKTKLEGYVWVDGTAGKESTYNGQSGDTQDKPMSGVKVILHQVSPSEAQANASQKGKNCAGTVKAETTTDANGHYGFYNLNAMYTYYVEFVYNGMYYQPTTYNGINYNSSYNPVNNGEVSWNRSSKGTDIKSQRQNLNAKFKEIGADPQNYQGGKAYTRTELRNMNAIDDFGNAGQNANSYVKDCMLSSYTGYNTNGNFQRTYYPVYDKFIIGDNINQTNRSALAKDSLGNYLRAYSILYNGNDKGYNNLYVNQGYVVRETVDLAVHKDVYKATLEIKEKKQTYKYNKNDGLSDEGFWEINTNISDAYLSEAYKKAKAGAKTDANAYYNKEDYTREIYKEDYSFKASSYGAETISKADINEDDELKVYVTYKITVRNQSDAIAAQVTELVDYYDKEYTLVTSGEYAPYVGDRKGNPVGVNINTSSSSKYSGTEKSASKYNKTYLTGFDSITLDPDSNKDMYLYVTFQVNKEDGHIILDEAESNGDTNGYTPKENIVEINGYRTYYTDRSVAPNAKNNRTDTEYVKGDVAGFMDIDSVAGNVIPDNIPDDNGTINESTFEDDTSKGPNIRIRLNREHTRTVDGTVFDDNRTTTENLSQIGDGIRQDNETGINGVKVDFIELLKSKDGSGTVEHVWKTMKSGDTTTQNFIIGNSAINVDQTYKVENDGQYKFESFAPGDYIIRFTYGDGTQTVIGTKSTNYETGEIIDNPIEEYLASKGLVKQDEAGNGYVENNQGNIIGINKKSYNGQDYKSTTYQIGVASNGDGAYQNVTSGSYNYDFGAADSGLYSDAKDIYSRRQEVNSYSQELTNGNAEVLASFEYLSKYYNELEDSAKATKIQTLLNELINKTYMVAETGIMNINFEYNRDNTEGNVGSNIGSSNYDKTGYYDVANVDFGLVQRPQAELKLTKQIANVKVTLANGNTLFDASQKATNVMWINQKAHGQDGDNTYKTNNNYHKDNYMNENVSRNNTLVKIPVVRGVDSKGRVQLTMDEELMHGSSIQITYVITVANIGEVDFADQKFYYTGVEDDPTANIVKTKVGTLVDYVGAQLSDDSHATRNNLQFSAEANPDWEATTVDDLKNSGIVNSNLENDMKQYNTIIKTKDSSTNVVKELVPIIWDEEHPEDSKPSAIKGTWEKDPQNVLENAVNKTRSVAGVKLVLTQTISSGSSSDDLTYNNIAELVKSSNVVGRRLAYSVAGNQKPTAEPYEIDADSPQEVVILPPFGQTTIYYRIGIAVGAILIVGIVAVIVIIKKKKTL